jgi:hypothetical protein
MSITKNDRIPKDVTNEQILEAILKCHGNLAETARSLGIRRMGLTRRIDKNEKLRVALAQARDEFIDLCEASLYDCVVKGSIPSIMFALKTIGKARGWGETTDINLNTKKVEEEEIDLSVLTQEEREKLDELTAKIYKTKPVKERVSKP